MIFNCPGSQKFKYPQPETIRCKNCREEVEIWSDEFETVCPKCKKKIGRDAGQSCLDWCKTAKECVGEEMYNRYLESKKRNKT